MHLRFLASAFSLFATALLLSALPARAQPPPQTSCGAGFRMVDPNSTLNCVTNGNMTSNFTLGTLFNQGNSTIEVRSSDTLSNLNYSAIAISSGSSAVINNGTITTGSTSINNTISLQAGAQLRLINYGLITSGGHTGATLLLNGQTSITNNSSGTITSTFAQYGIVLANASAVASVDNSGTISGTRNAIRVTYGKLNLTVRDGSVFTGGVDFNNTAGNTINFRTGNYSLAVLAFQSATNTVNTLSPGSVLNFTGADTANGNGSLVVTTPAPAPAASMPGATQAAATAVQSALQMATPRNYVPPVQNIIPDTSIATAPASTAGPANAPPMNLGMRGSYEDAPLPSNTQGFDRYGNLVWARAFGSAHFQPSTDAIAGTINRTTGVLVGYDRQFTNWRLGVYGGYGLSNTALADSSGKLQTEMYIGGLYGRTKLAGATVTINLAGGLLGNHSSRIINGGRDAGASADFSGAFVAPDVAVAYDIPLGNGFTLTPGLRARYIGTFTQDYAETGSTQNITYQGAKSHMLEERAELRLARTQRVAGTLLTTHLDGALIASQRLGAGAISASVLGTEFSVQNGTAGTLTGLMLGAGLDMQLSRDISVYTSGDVAEYTDGSKAASARVGLRMGF